MTRNSEFLSVKQAAEDLSMSRVGVQKWIEQGKVKAIKVGSVYIIEVTEVARVKKQMISGLDKKLSKLKRKTG